MNKKDSPVFGLTVDRRTDCWSIALRFTIGDKALQRTKSLISGLLVPFVISGAGITLIASYLPQPVAPIEQSARLPKQQASKSV